MSEPHSRCSAMGAICVLDLETAPDPMALSLAGLRKAERAHGAAALHQITDATVLHAREEEDGSWSGFQLSSYTVRDSDEAELLRSLDLDLDRLRRQDGTIVTYNGVRHDLPVLRRRAARHLMFDGSWILPDDKIRHYDLMLMAPGGRSGSWSKLRDAAAGLGIPVAHQLPTRGLGTATAGVRKSQVDVLATFLVMLHDVALRRGSSEPLRRGWRSLAQYIGTMGPHGDHLAQYRRHPLAAGSDEPGRGALAPVR
jgi:hypothetical protein